MLDPDGTHGLTNHAFESQVKDGRLARGSPVRVPGQRPASTARPSSEVWYSTVRPLRQRSDQPAAVQHGQVLGDGARRDTQAAGQPGGRRGGAQRVEQPGPRRPEQRLDRRPVRGDPG